MFNCAESLDRDPTHGPLYQLIPVFVDFEMYMDREIRLGNMTLRQYLKKSYITAVSIAIGEAEPVVVENDSSDEYEAVIETLRELSQRDDVVIVAHNAAFDVRVMRFKCGIPQPKHVWCTLEGAMGSWPESKNGFSLWGLSETLRLAKPKLEFDLAKLDKFRKQAERAQLGVPVLNIDEDFRAQLIAVFKAGGVVCPSRVTVDDFDAALLIYNKRDVEATQELFFKMKRRLPPVEQWIALITNDVRKHWFEISEDRLQSLTVQLNTAARGAEAKAVAALKTGTGSLKNIFNEETELAEDEMTDDAIAQRHIFNHDTADGELGSIRYQRLKKILHAKFHATDLESTSLKKLSPVKLAKYPSVHAMLLESSYAGKMVYHRRKADMFKGVDQVDVELRYMGSHTGRFSSPGAGGAKSLNLHNLPKHLIQVAKPVRELFRVPSQYCLVRADFANVELRVEGILTNCQAILRMFDPEHGGDPLADPYVVGWKNMTRIVIDKKTEKGKNMRQLSKAAHLALGFCQSAAGFTGTSLLRAIANGDTTEAALHDLIQELRWYPPKFGVFEIIEKLGCSHTVALAAFHIHRVFNEAHPEFRQAAEWLYRCVEAMSPCVTVADANRRLDRMRESESAIDPSMVYLYAEMDEGDRHPSIRAQCGPWAPTVCWREPLLRPFGPVGSSDIRLTVRKANGRFKVFTKQIAIENITQAAARNQLCWGILELKKLGYDDIFHVHDEIMLMVPRVPEAALGARDALVKVFGPTATGKPLKWATLIKPSEISVTQSLWEDEKDLVEFYEDKKTKKMLPGGNRWHRIEQNLPGCLDTLP